MQYHVLLAPKAEKALSNLSAKDSKRILTALFGIARDPLIGKQLKGELQTYFSLRVWPYRIIYSMIDKELVILVIAIGHRKDIYKKL